MHQMYFIIFSVIIDQDCILISELNTNKPLELQGSLVPLLKALISLSLTVDVQELGSILVVATPS
jgi:hypothetical protein